jgi:hypothetical protein
LLRVGRRKEGGGSDGWGPLGSNVRGNAIDGLHKLEEEVPFGKYAKASQAEWTEHAHDGLRAKRPGLLGAGPDGPESEEKWFPNKIWIFDYTKALEICTRRFWRNFDMRIFPKFFYALQGF